MKKTQQIKLKINSLTKKFDNYSAVNQLSLEIERPGLYLFVGDNGSGKTTLFNLITGLINADEGKISLNGITNVDLRRKQLGISTESFITEPSLTVLEIAEIIRLIKRVSSKEIKELLIQWEMWNARKKPFKTLSTGMKKRLSLALSMPGNPDYLLWDEPFNGLDPLGIKLLNCVIQELCEKGKTILLTTHLLNEINVTATICFVMKNGNLAGSVHIESTPDFNTTILNLLKNE
ncbi:ABC transporter ATP-binding protein [Maribellus maritimus]|uniref:ABC transporter ATP-binding protein n=1 Tax=Maribellus maritimus TaxID=2870838 RepID=UPI001EEAA0BE|nr:ABC transporter ATP-binding protein [Maribellus maritimus]MCG6190163.1 ABC transporter ATP-binding protein [Maribellus maritimus]